MVGKINIVTYIIMSGETVGSLNEKILNCLGKLVELYDGETFEPWNVIFDKNDVFAILNANPKFKRWELRYNQFTNNDITDIAMKILGDNKNISVVIYENRITRPFMYNINGDRINVAFNNESDDDTVIGIIEKLKLIKNIGMLDLGNNKISNKGIKAISDYLMGNNTITDVRLEDININNTEYGYIHDALVTNKNIQNLYLSNPWFKNKNEMPDELKKFEKLLKPTTTIPLITSGDEPYNKLVFIGRKTKK